MYDLIHRINNNRSVSKTSLEQEWEIPSVKQLVKEKYSKGTHLAKIVPQQNLGKVAPMLKLTVEVFKGLGCAIEKVVADELITL